MIRAFSRSASRSTVTTLVLVVFVFARLSLARNHVDGDWRVRRRARQHLRRLILFRLLFFAAPLVPRLGHGATSACDREESTTQPGGQVSLRPASRCMCRWSTLWPASAPWLKTSR